MASLSKGNIREIYCKLPTDRNYKYQIESVDEVDNILQQIRMMLGTKPGEVLGSPRFGLDLSQFLFEYNIPKKDITDALNDQISSYVKYDTAKWTITTDVKYGKELGTDMEEYAVIDIYINSVKLLGIMIEQ